MRSSRRCAVRPPRTPTSAWPPPRAAPPPRPRSGSSSSPRRSLSGTVRALGREKGESSSLSRNQCQLSALPPACKARALAMHPRYVSWSRPRISLPSVRVFLLPASLDGRAMLTLVLVSHGLCLNGRPHPSRGAATAARTCGPRSGGAALCGDGGRFESQVQSRAQVQGRPLRQVLHALSSLHALRSLHALSTLHAPWPPADCPSGGPRVRRLMLSRAKCSVSYRLIPSHAGGRGRDDRRP